MDDDEVMDAMQAEAADEGVGTPPSQPVQGGGAERPVAQRVELSTGIVIERARIPWGEISKLRALPEEEQEEAASALIEASIISVQGLPEHGGHPSSFAELDVSEIAEYGRLVLAGDDPKSSASGPAR